MRLTALSAVAGLLAAALPLASTIASAEELTVITAGDQNMVDYVNNFLAPAFEKQNPGTTVRVVGTGICHTDLATRDEHLHTPMPAVLGHEGAGVVEVVGDGVVDVAPGDKVLLSFSSCGHCSACLHGHPAYCVNFIPMNFDGARPDGTS